MPAAVAMQGTSRPAPSGPVDVVVIGAGLAGLACAVALSDAGLRVAVCERSDRIGGRAGSWVDAATGDTVDIGPHILLTEYQNMLRLLDRLGTRERVVWQKDKLITLVAGRRAFALKKYPLPAPLHYLPSILRTPVFSWRDAASNLPVTWYAMKIGEAEVQRLDTLSAGDFLRGQGVTPAFMQSFWASASMWIMNVPLERCSAGALMRFYRQIIGHGDYHIGFAGQGLSELYGAPAVRVVESAGGRVLLQAEVSAFAGGAEGITGVTLSDGRRLTARWCVAAVPPQDLQALLPPAWTRPGTAFDTLSDFEPDPYISSYIWFDRKLTFERYWARLWSPANLNYDSYDLSNIRPGWSGRPSVIASNIIYSHRAHGMSDEEIVAETVRELAEFLPGAPSAGIRHARVHRIPMAIPCPYPGIERKRPPAGTPVPGLLLAGDWTRTGLPASMESAVRSGWLAAERILAEAGKPRHLAVPARETEGLAGLVRRLHAKRGRRPFTRAPG